MLYIHITGMKPAFCSILTRIPPLFTRLSVLLILMGLALYAFTSNFASCAQYNTRESFERMLEDPNWTWNGTKWDVIQGGSLTSGSINCGQVNFSTKVTGPCTITFNWEKVGDAVLICHYDNYTDPAVSPICNQYSFSPSRIRIPPGVHTVIWDMKVDSCDGNHGCEAHFNNINIPEPTYYPPDCNIITNNQVVLGQTSIASVPYAGTAAHYNWQISKGGIINSRKPYSNKIIWKAMSLGPINLEVSVGNENGSSNGRIERNVSERERVPITNRMDLDEEIKKSENKILVLEDGVYQDEININVKNLDIIPRNQTGVKFDTRGSNYSIAIENTSDVSIIGMTLADCQSGIIIDNCTNCSVMDNNITYKNLSGIFLENSSFNNISNNFVKSEQNGFTQGIALQNSTNNNINNNSIFKSHFIYVLNYKSINNLIFHNFEKFKGNILSVIIRPSLNDFGSNCTVNCSGPYRHRLNCNNHVDNRRNCAQCVSCDKIGSYNTWTCI